MQREWKNSELWSADAVTVVRPGLIFERKVIVAYGRLKIIHHGRDGVIHPRYNNTGFWLVSEQNLFPEALVNECLPAPIQNTHDMSFLWRVARGIHQNIWGLVKTSRKMCFVKIFLYLLVSLKVKFMGAHSVKGELGPFHSGLKILLL
jgi:hypothetical protein